MSIVTPKTDFYDLLSDVVEYLDDVRPDTEYVEVNIELRDRCWTALSELEGSDGDGSDSD